MMTVDANLINDFIEHQLDVWPEAKKNYDALISIERKNIPIGAFDVVAQCNPARIVSTAAKTDEGSIRKRACFLCKENRPASQVALPFFENWDLLLNPFPILPVHFTIVDTTHRAQDAIPLEMASMAEKAPDLVIFFNGAKAGASAPDHRHCQAVLKTELPIIKIVEKYHSPDMAPILKSEDWEIDLPFNFVSAVVTPDKTGEAVLYAMSRIGGLDSVSGKFDSGLVNAFFWIDCNLRLRIVVIPRKAHRPDCFYHEGDRKMTVSPGALDMAGLMILPLKNDFDRITSEKAREIYTQVAFSGNLPDEVFSRIDGKP